MFVAEGCCGGCVSIGDVCGGDGSSSGGSGLAVAVLVVMIAILLLLVMIVVVAECENLLQSPLLQRVYSCEVQITKLYCTFAIKVAYKLPICAPSMLPKFNEARI
jgi:hypothetical protein